MDHSPRSRRQTRAALMARLLAHGNAPGLYRPRLAAEARLTEASVSRIIAELKAEGLVAEPRCPAPYAGGPTSMVTFSQDLHFAAIEIASDRLTIGGGGIASPAFVERRPLPREPGALAAALASAVRDLAAAASQHGVHPRQIGVSLPGYRGDARPNPILPLDPLALRRLLAEHYPGVPVAIANAVVAQAAAQLHRPAGWQGPGRQLFVYLAHGVAGAWIDPAEPPAAIRALELGHVVLDAKGPLCRCGHRGCLEARASTAALAQRLDVPEAALIEAGDGWAGRFPLGALARQAVQDMLGGLGLVLGNALNLLPAERVVICGWPASLPPEDRAAVGAGMDRSLFGGLAQAGITLEFLPPDLGSEPRGALAWAAHCFVEAGGLATGA
ncbi:ROK family protein [Roseomonas aerophila]|uniref:ROK family protein n=1 Tax=Teichococcus aerophilus TaxID=1224513 RepID=A0ABR7RKP0_9PROT|nr:ROK family protein [Pseudoroseomonas aerophila]MBC9207150.1 ROK family protein [Pseudoroseomonas aerophila]